LDERFERSHSAPEALPEENAEDLYENAPCGYLSTLLDGTLLKVNTTFLSWTGYARQDLVLCKRFLDLLSPGSRIFYETHYAPLLHMQGFVREIAAELICADGSRLPTLINATLKKDGDGRPLLIRTTVLTATDRRRYERELLRERQRAEHAAKVKVDFISMISHEIRTPLNAILGIGHLLEKSDLTPKQQQLVRVLRTSSDNLLGLINDILDFSKIEAGKVSLEERNCDLGQLVQGIADNLRVKAESKGLAFRIDLDPRLPERVLADPVKIGQVLTNLLGNAIKFTLQGSVALILTIREQTSDSLAIEFRVADTGIGIAAERLPHIFEEFIQASYEIGLQYGGTGLGLSISNKLLGLYGSRLEVESEEGRGTTFFFTLRCRTSPAAGASPLAAAAPVPTDPRSLAGAKILVADDNEVNVMVLSAFLRKWGVEVDVAANGRQAVDRTAERAYDLVLMDLRMPEMDGYAATRTIRARADARLPALPILAISTAVRSDQKRDLDAVGFTDFLSKPVDPDALFAMLVRYIRGPGA